MEHYVLFPNSRREDAARRVPCMWLEKLIYGVLQVLTTTGQHHVRLSFIERLRLIWIFRNFSILPQQVLTSRQRCLVSGICAEERMLQYWGPGERERSPFIGTLMLSVFPRTRRADEKRTNDRYAVPFEVRYGVGKDLAVGEGCDLGAEGLAFVGPTSYAPGTELELRYRLEPQAMWTRVRALVRHVNGSRTGVEFLIVRKIQTR
jgi:PilZ domain